MDKIFEITAKEVTIQVKMSAQESNTVGHFRLIIMRMRMF